MNYRLYDPTFTDRRINSDDIATFEALSERERVAGLTAAKMTVANLPEADDGFTVLGLSFFAVIFSLGTLVNVPDRGRSGLAVIPLLIAEFVAVGTIRRYRNATALGNAATWVAAFECLMEHKPPRSVNEAGD